MRNRRIAILAAMLIGVVTAVVAATAGADDITHDPDAVNPAAGATVQVNITLVPTADSTGETNSGHTCNLENTQNEQGHFVDVSVTSSDETVATVSPNPLRFTACDTRQITITAVSCGTATITLAVAGSNPPNQTYTVSDNTIAVTVDANCDGSGEVTACAKPAAPAWAAAILKANGVKPKQADNLIALVAQEMTQGATFHGIAKSNQEAYSQEVYVFLQTKKSGLTVGPADAAKPGWGCQTSLA